MDHNICMNWTGGNVFKMTYPSYNVPFYLNSQSQNFSYLSPNINENLILETENYQEQRVKDELFLLNFLNSKERQKIIKRKTCGLKIYEAKKYLSDIMRLKKELETDSKNINIDNEDFDETWDAIVIKQNKINELLAKFNDESVGDLKSAIQRRKKKRIQEGKRKLKQKQLKKEREENIKAMNFLIDKLLNEKSKEVESIKRKEAFKRQADSVLHEVRKKKYEAKKMLNMLSAILKLRELRSQQEVAQGGYCSEQVTETFNSVINHFQELWKKQNEIYNLEERGLRVMLEENEIPQLKMSNFQKILNQWERAIFGTPSTDDNYRFLTQAENDINSFVYTRREWDQFLVDQSVVLSSQIPVGWVLPPETEDPEWKSFSRFKRKH